MISVSLAARLDLDDAAIRETYDRVPFGFSHKLHRFALYEHETLRPLCERHAAHPEDYSVSHTTPSPGAVAGCGRMCAPAAPIFRAFTLIQRARANALGATQ